MVAFVDLISDVETDVYSFVDGIDQTTWLTAICNSGDLTVTVADASQLRDGFIEITSTAGNELISISGSDDATIVTVPPWGRAQRGTSAYTHPSLSRVVSNPQFPRSRIAQVINECLADLYPEIFAVDFNDQPTSCNTWAYSLPTEADGLVDVLMSEDNRPEHGWQPLRRMRYDKTSNTITIASPPSATTLRVVYRHPVSLFVNLADTLTSVGLDDSYRSLIRSCAFYKLLSSLMSQRLQISSVEASVNVQLRQPDYVNNAIKTAYSQYQLKLADKRGELLLRYPPLRYKTF